MEAMYFMNEASTKAGSLVSGVWELVWNEEFQGPKINRDIWSFEIGKWPHNGELQYYTDDPAHAYIENDKLVIKATMGPAGRYVSARLKSEGGYTLKYGKIEVSARLPEGQGIWPAIWLLGANEPEVGWPRCGEIDIMECLGSDPTTVYGTAHGPLSAGVGICSKYTSKDGSKFSDDFHVFGLEWNESCIKWLVDGYVYHEIHKNAVAKGDWVFDHEFYFIINVAVGGHWPGFPDERTIFPQTMEVDYIRVYKVKESV